MRWFIYLTRSLVGPGEQHVEQAGDQARKRTADKKAASSDDVVLSVPSRPEPPHLHQALCSATCTAILEFVGNSCRPVNKSWVAFAQFHSSQLTCTASWGAVPQQLQSLSTGEHAFQKFKMHANVQYLSVCNLDDADDLFLKELAKKQVLPRLSFLDVSGCQKMSSNGVRALAKGLGSNLRGFAQNVTKQRSLCKGGRERPPEARAHLSLHCTLTSRARDDLTPHPPKEMQVTPATIKLISTAAHLQALSLTLPSKIKVWATADRLTISGC